MKLTEKMSYLQGLLDGLEIDTTTKEGKLLNQMAELMQFMVESIDDLQSQVDELTELCDILDEDLGGLEEDYYDCDCDCDCDCDDDCDCDCGCCDDDDFDFDFRGTCALIFTTHENDRNFHIGEQVDTYFWIKISPDHDENDNKSRHRNRTADCPSA